MVIFQFDVNYCCLQNGLFGEGTYLSSEMGVSMPYAPTGQSWQHSVIGDRLSLIAVCEIINDDSVKCQIKGIVTVTLIDITYNCHTYRHNI